MRYAMCLLAMASASYVGCATTAAPDEPGPSADTSTPAGFETWLVEQCPDGASVGAKDAGTGDVIAVMTCEEAREKALADPAGRERMLGAYMAQTEEHATGPQSWERVGEAREPFSLLGLICSLVVDTAIGYQCHRTNAYWSDCVAAGVVPTIVCNFL